MKMIVNIETVLELKNQLNKINDIDLNDIEWYENGIPLNIEQSIIDEYLYVGLNNTDFITTNFYKGKYE